MFVFASAVLIAEAFDDDPPAHGAEPHAGREIVSGSLGISRGS